jgi:hypothetical protein
MDRPLDRLNVFRLFVHPLDVLRVPGPVDDPEVVENAFPLVLHIANFLTPYSSSGRTAVSVAAACPTSNRRVRAAIRNVDRINEREVISGERFRELQRRQKVDVG